MTASYRTILIVTAVLLLGIGIVVASTQKLTPLSPATTSSEGDTNLTEDELHTLSLSQSDDPDVLDKENSDVNLDSMNADVQDFDNTLDQIPDTE
jgi:hypothetical protein